MKKTAVAKKATPAKKTAGTGGLLIPSGLEPMVTEFEGEKGVTVEKGWGASSVVLKTRGKIFVMLLKGELVFKLPSPRVDELVDAGARRFDPRGDGRVMKEWAVVPIATRNRTTLAREAMEFVGGAAGKKKG
jgi:hypothetical protein